MPYEQSSALTGAADWLLRVFLGSVATTVAVLAVAAVGVLMLTGRIDWRQAARVVLGCFILFGATQIATGLRIAVGETASALPVQTAPAELPPPPPKPAVAQYDPYAGASVNRGQ